MLNIHADVPSSAEYPLEKVVELLPALKRGTEKQVKYFTSSFSYMLALAIAEGFERIEVYGFELAAGDEYVPQKACAEFWMGFALGKGIEVFLPEGSQLCWGPLYGYQGHGAANVV
jgi:hypothetical protein